MPTASKSTAGAASKLRELINPAIKEDDYRTAVSNLMANYFDDTKRYIEAAAINPEQRHKIYEGNARRVFPRLDAALKLKGQ